MKIPASTLIPGSALKGACTTQAHRVSWPAADVLRVFGGPRPGDDSDQACRGGVRFWDALPQRQPRLVVDVLTPHVKPYYDQANSNKQVTIPPAEYHNPVPVRFLAVEHWNVEPDMVLLAKALEGTMAQQITRPGELLGDVAYMSPERTQSGGVPDGRSDIYSLGIVLYEALGGEVPIPVAGCKDTVPVLPPLHRQNPQVSVGLADIIHKCSAHEPKDRYADGASLAADLRRHLSDLPLRGVRNRSPLERWRKWRSTAAPTSPSSATRRPSPPSSRWAGASRCGLRGLASSAAQLWAPVLSLSPQKNQRF